MLNNWDKWGDKAIRKDNLQIGSYYGGICRNARIARWDGQKFIHWREKFGKTFLEDIEYWDINGHFDGFIPLFKIGLELPAPIDIEKYNKPKEPIKFILNGTLAFLEFGDVSITYERICQLANLNPDYNPSITVAYANNELPDRCVKHNEYVTLTKGCVINACYTGNS
jgi:hypothetical protein